MSEKRDNSGALFKNKDKKSDNHPDYRGPCMVNGVELEVSAWLKESGSGTKYMSLSFKPPYKKDGAHTSKPQHGDEDLERPF